MRLRGAADAGAGLAGAAQARAAARQGRNLAWLAGLLFALDLLFWHHAIEYVGAGLATVLGNLQVFIVAFAAWAVFRERPSNRLMLATPVVFVGVVLISGVFDSAAYGANPALGRAHRRGHLDRLRGFMLLLKGGRGARGRGRSRTPPRSPRWRSRRSARCSAGADFVPAWPAHGWLLLLALGPQLLGWSLIAYSLPRQPAALTALLLLIQPMTTVALSAALLGERPSPLQLAGCAVIVAGVLCGLAAASTGQGRLGAGRRRCRRPRPCG